MFKNHFPGHQQVLLHKNIVIAILSFDKHKKLKFKKVFKKFDYDKSVDLCKHNIYEVGIGFLWNGKKFIKKPYDSWILSDNLEWVPPISKPEGHHGWHEESMSWKEIDPNCGCIKE